MIPEWTPKGVLPPYDPAAPRSRKRSPYRASLTDFVLRYATSAARKTILRGFLSFRQALHAAGLEGGFQWIDGSFLENIEVIEGRDPNDVDVVTFYHLPEGQTQVDLYSHAPVLFDHDHNKAAYAVDAYFRDFGGSTFEPLMNDSVYWYSLWSHRRNEQWKGYLQIDLSPADDQVAQVKLDEVAHQGGQP